MNLLTDHLKGRARTQLIATALWRMSALLLVESIAIAIVFVAGHAVMERSFATLVERTSLVLRGSGGTSQRVRTTNEFLLALEQLRGRYTPWTMALTAITDRVPSGITLTALAVDQHTALRIEGHAETRESLLTYRDAIQGLSFSHDVAVPFSNLLQRERIDFSISGRVDRALVVLPSTPL